MPDSKIKTALMNAMQQSMRDKNKARLGALRLALAAIKQVEVDDRIELADDQVIAILDKMVNKGTSRLNSLSSQAGTNSLPSKKMK